MWDLTPILLLAKSLPDIPDAAKGVTAFTRKLFKSRRVVFTGKAGVGKTVLFDHLRGAHKGPGYAPPGPSLKAEKGRVRPAGKSGKVLVVPGDISSPRLEALDRVFKEGMPDVFVHCVANGYTTIRSPFAAGARAAGRLGIAGFRLDEHNDELRDLHDLATRIEAASRKDPKPFAFLIAVAKADLYAGELVNAEERYAPGGPGPFSEAVASLANRVGTIRMRWDAWPVATWLEEFTFGTKKMPTALDTAQRDAMLAVFAHKLGRLINAS